MFSTDYAEAEKIKKVSILVTEAMMNCIKLIFFQSFMNEDGTIQWTNFTKFINKRVEDIAKEG